MQRDGLPATLDVGDKAPIDSKVYSHPQLRHVARLPELAQTKAKPGAYISGKLLAYRHWLGIALKGAGFVLAVQNAGV